MDKHWQHFIDLCEKDTLMDGMTPTETEQPRKRTLADITQDLINAEMEGGGEVTALYAELERELDGKALGYQIVGSQLKAAKAGQAAQKKFHDDEAQRFAKRMEAIDKSYENLKARLAESMRATAKDEIVTVRGKIYFQTYPVVKLPEGWALKAAADYPQYVQEKPAVIEPKKTVLLTDFKEMVKSFIKSGRTKAEAWEAAKEMMPEGFDVDPNEKLNGV